MSIRVRLCTAFLLLTALGFYELVRWNANEVRPRYLETVEESIVDTAILLASHVSSQATEGTIPTDDLRAAFDEARKRQFSAKIYDIMKTRLDLRVYVTDARGRVIFDSNHGKDEGKDYSRWNDVYLTLKGKYGVRSTRIDPEDPRTSSLYVAAPILVRGEIAGVLTVCKPARSVNLFIRNAKINTVIAGIIACAVVVVVGMALSLWITWPIGKLTRYARAVRDGKRVSAPRLGRSEIGDLGAAFEEMRKALEGKQYVEGYVSALAHQMKSPLSAIRGSAELLEEEMPPEDRRRFLRNLRSETERIQDIIDRMLQLSTLENRNALREVEDVDLGTLLAEILESLRPVLSKKRLRAALDAPVRVSVRGERFLLRQALLNLLENGVAFSPEMGELSIVLRQTENAATVQILDNGPGIPAYALDKVFDRFYSLPRPDTGKKSSGLGLAFVREAAELHGGRVAIENRPEGCARAVLILPLSPPPPRI